MQRLILTLTIGLFSINRSYSQVSDTVYYIQFISNDTQAGIPFVKLKATEHGIHNGSWISDTAGVVEIRSPYYIWRNEDIDYRIEEEIRITSDTKFTASCNGYLKLDFDSAILNIGDTTQVILSSGYYSFDLIEIIGYKIPQMQKHLSLSEREQQAYVDSQTDPTKRATYSDDVLAKYDSIVNGTWFQNQPKNAALNESEFYHCLRENLRYPYYAQEQEIEEVILFLLTFEKDGTLVEIELAKGKCPVLVIEVARILSTISKVLFQDSENRENVQTLILPVKFSLK